MHQQDPDRRRSHPRYDVKDVEGSFMLSSDISITDLSVDGIGIETHTGLSVGRAYRLRVFRSGYPLDLTARVAWSRMVGTEKAVGGDVLPVYRAGLQFDGHSAETANAWQQFVGSKLPVHLEKTLLGRLLPIDEPELDLEFAAEVISLSGMRILVGPDVQVQDLLKKTFPIEVKIGDKAFSNKVRVLNFAATEGEEAAGFRVGLQWVELGNENRSALEGFIAAHFALSPEQKT